MILRPPRSLRRGLQSKRDFLSWSSNVKDDTGFVSLIGAFYGSFMPGYSFDSAAQVMTLFIVGFARSMALQVCPANVVDLKLTQEEVFGIEQNDQFVEPGDEE